MIKKPALLLFTILASQMAGVAGSVATAPAIPIWYAELTKPSFSPPNYLFGPVWITLYALMGVAWYLVWVKAGKRAVAVKFFGAHLVLNSAWSLVFFGLKDIVGGLILIILLWMAIGYLVFLFGKIEKRAAYLLLPYWAWVSFATMLNLAIWRLN